MARIRRPDAVLKALETDDWLMAFIKMGYGDMFGLSVRSLWFRTEKAHPLALLPSMRLLVYGTFDGEAVAVAIEELHEAGHLSTVEFGREYAAVMYVDIPFWTGQRSNFVPGQENRKLTEAEMDASREAVGRAMVDLGAAEIGFYDAELRSILRVWWD